MTLPPISGSVRACLACAVVMHAKESAPCRGLLAMRPFLRWFRRPPLQTNGINYALVGMGCPALAIAGLQVAFQAPNKITVQLPDIGLECTGNWAVAGNGYFHNCWIACCWLAGCPMPCSSLPQCVRVLLHGHRASDRVQHDGCASLPCAVYV